MEFRCPVIASKRLDRKQLDRFKFTALLLSVSALAFSAGCGGTDQQYELAEVRGTVSLNGNPLANTSEHQFKVMFAPISRSGESKAGKPGLGMLSDDGSYILSTYGSEDGAVVGKHWVTIVRTTAASGDNPDNYRPAKFDRIKLPSPLEVEPGKENVIDLSATGNF